MGHDMLAPSANFGYKFLIAATTIETLIKSPDDSFCHVTQYSRESVGINCGPVAHL